LKAAVDLALEVGVQRACKALGVSRATFYRRRAVVPKCQQPRRRPIRSLGHQEREHVLAVLDSERFVDRAPAEVVATLLDEEQYLCSERTMYRLLAGRAPVRDRRNQLRHPEYAKPELLATAPNQVWSWDITKLLGPKKWTYYYLYVVMDIYSRKAVGWMLADRENANLAGHLIEECCTKEGVRPDILTLHSDRGSPMTAKCSVSPPQYALVLAERGRLGWLHAALHGGTGGERDEGGRGYGVRRPGLRCSREGHVAADGIAASGGPTSLECARDARARRG
jgi:putative transposase